MLVALAWPGAATSAAAEDAEVFNPDASGQVAPGNDAVRAPAAKPKAAPDAKPTGVSIVGTWTLLTKCADHDVSASVEITAAGPGGVTGRIFNASNGVDAAISGGALKGNAIRFDNTYSFLGKHVELWTGTVSTSGTRISGTLTGFAANDCHFTLSR